MLSNCRPFLIVLDLEMPVMDGRSFCDRQRQLGSELSRIPVLLCSAASALERTARELGAFAWMPKPVPDLDLLLDDVKEAYNRFHASVRRRLVTRAHAAVGVVSAQMSSAALALALLVPALFFIKTGRGILSRM
jgi:DNA-binding response OmpR family regulator